MATLLRDLIDDILDSLEEMGLPASRENLGRLIFKINKAQERISRDLEVPRRYIKGVDATVDFELPAEARDTGLWWVEREEKNDKPIPIFTVTEANHLGIRWDLTDDNTAGFQGHTKHGKYIVIYDPANISAPVKPLGFSAGDTIRLEYVIKPSKLNALDDTGVDSGVTTAAQTDTTVTISGGSFLFDATHVEWKVIWDDGTEARITGFTNTTTVEVDRSQTKTAEEFTLKGTSIPFEGQIPDYDHDLIVQYVLFDTLFKTNISLGPDRPLPWQVFLNDYNSLMEKALAKLRPPFYLPKTRDWNDTSHRRNRRP